jgi:hypothetical protein
MNQDGVVLRIVHDFEEATDIGLGRDCPIGRIPGEWRQAVMEQALTMAPGLLAGIGMRLSGVIGAAKSHDRPDPVIVANALQTREGQLAAAIEDPGPNHTEIPPMWILRPSVQKRPTQDTDEQGNPEHKPDAMSHNETSVPPRLFARWTSNVPSPLQFVCAGSGGSKRRRIH